MISKNNLKFVHQLEQKKYRRKEGVFVAEGPKVVGDLMTAGVVPRMLFAVEEWIKKEQTEYAQEVTEEELRKLSFLQHPQQVLGVFEIPASSTCNSISDNRLYLALDGVQDPGNLGTIIRLADWFGINTIFCSEDTADVWNPKVIQATMGSIARVEVVYTDLKQLIVQANMPIYGTLLDGQNIYEQELRHHRDGKRREWYFTRDTSTNNKQVANS